MNFAREMDWNRKDQKKSTYLKEEISALGVRAPSRDRTSDLLITSQLLYQLSYGGDYWCA